MNTSASVSPRPPAWAERLQHVALQRPIVTIIIVAALTMLPGLGGGYLWDRDETWYAGSALDMVKTGDWLIPSLGTRTFLEKPPLAYWMMAINFQWFGFTEFGARLPSALSAIGTLIVVYAMGAFWVSRAMGLLAAAIMATTLHFGVLSRSALTDPILGLAMTGAIACWWRMQEPGDRPTSYITWCFWGGVAVGLALLAKGPFGLLPGVVALVYMICARDFTFLLRAKWGLLVGLVTLLLVGVPWYFQVWLSPVGADFINDFFFEHNVKRSLKPMQGHGGPFFYYLPVLILGLMPWTMFLIAMPFGPRRPFDKFDLMLACWAALPILFFSSIVTKLPHYIAPSIQPLSLLLAREVMWRVEHGVRPAWLLSLGFWLWTFVGAVFLAVSVATIFLIEDFPWLAILGPGIILLVGFGWASLKARADDGWSEACWASGVAITLFFLWVGLISLNQLKAVQVAPQIALAAAERARADDGKLTPDEIFCYRYFEPSMFLYTDTAMVWGKDDALGEALEQTPPGESLFIITRQRDEERLYFQLRERGLPVEPESFESLHMKHPALQEAFARAASKRFRLRLLEVVPEPN
jgi:4-amino-4-deoxy-L-arabinose transferase-like glycosyltransferase